MEPRTVGRYALIKLIGHGGMADVWTGKVYGASGFEKIVAVKLLAPGTVDQEEYQRALTNEARLQVNLKHPNIVDIYDFNFEAENPYLVMEYVEGIELRRLLKVLRERGQTLPSSLAAYIISEISKALSHAHERRHPKTGEPLNIVHRDVSPSNILISINGDVKLSDFGIAKSSLQSSFTQVGQIKGKFRYMSPEQAEGGSIDHRSDIFSLGLVFYESLFGTPAYDDASDAKILQMARMGTIHLPEKIHPDMREILQRLLTHNPKERYADMAAFRKELSQYVQLKGDSVHREEVVDYLKGLALEEFQDAVSARKEAEEWKPVPSAQVLDHTGKITLLAESPPRTRKKLFLIGGVSGLAVLAIALFALNYSKKTVISKEVSPSSGRIHIETSPPEAVVRAKYGDTVLTRPSPVSLTDIPLGQPVEINVSKKGYRAATKNITLTQEKLAESMNVDLQEVKDVQVKFMAEPYAEVSVPGIFTNVETPLSKTLAAGNYDVVFTHGPSGRHVSARLNGSQGGNFTCSANMAVSDPSSTPTATCRVRPP